MKNIDKLKFERPPEYVAGAKAIGKAIGHIHSRMEFSKAFKVLSKLNQKEGVDCPGCAWPDPEKRSKLGEFCENGIKAIAEEAMDARAGPDFFERHTIEDLLNKSDYWLGHQGRLTHPMVIFPGESNYRPVDWKDAFELIGTKLNGLNHPDEAIFYTSGRTSNEAAFLYQLFVRMYGTNNLPDCSNMCHESSGVALNETLGIGKGSVKIEDFYHADVILIFGQNPATNHPRMLSALEKAKKHGARIVVINPLKEVGLVRFKNPQTVSGLLGKGSRLADLYLQVRINEDVALLKAVISKLFLLSESDPSVVDHEFIERKTSGYESLKKGLASYNLPDLIERTGLTEQQIDELVSMIAGNKNIIACWAMGLTQHKNAVDNIREIVNLLLLKGSIGRTGAGTCPVRGHSNVQGDRTVGIHERPSSRLLDKISENFGFIPPQRHGYSTIEAIEAMHDRKASVFLALGGNFLSAAPDTNYTSRALKNCDLSVHISTKLNRSHLVHGKTSLILPCLGRSDKDMMNGHQSFLSVENSMGIVHSTKGVLEPPSKVLKSEPAIIAGIASATLDQTKLDWDYLVEDYGRIRDLIEKTISGFEGYNEKLKSGKQLELPNGPRHGKFNTSDGKARFTLNSLPDYQLEEGEFMMMTIRSHDQFNTTIYGLDDRYRGVFNGRKVVFMNVDDAKELKLDESEKVSLYNNYDGVERKIEGFTVVPYDIPSKCLATYFPEANPLIPLSQFAHTSLTPASKSVKVRIGERR